MPRVGSEPEDEDDNSSSETGGNAHTLENSSPTTISVLDLIFNEPDPIVRQRHRRGACWTVKRAIEEVDGFQYNYVSRQYYRPIKNGAFVDREGKHAPNLTVKAVLTSNSATTSEELS
ncbi:MAG: hypothetical protein M1834_004283 [Cirrosporium novae-zelandiae]|nr:MAG: hypothetical protein M1834_004283 [Cirrosporium novae-zelandiae]